VYLNVDIMDCVTVKT